MHSADNTKKRHLVALLFLGMLSPTAPAQTFHILDLGTLGGSSSAANAIADTTAVVGWADQATEQRAPFLIECKECPMLNLGFLAYGTDGSATTISNNGDYVAGYSGTTFNSGNPEGGDPPLLGTEVPQAFMWYQGTMHELGALYDPAFVGRRHGHSEAHGVNNRGQVVGFSVILRAGALHAFLWENGEMRDLTPEGAASADITRAFGINNKSQIVGDAAPVAGSPVTYAFRSALLWEGDTAKYLQSLEDHNTASARAINEHSQIVGWSGVTDADHADLLWSHAVLWDNNTLQSLGTLAGDNSSQALAINDRGAITGWSGSIDQGLSRAFLWRCEQMQDLNTLIPTGTGWHLMEARGISNEGQIVGIGLKDGITRAYRLIPLGGMSGACPGT